MQIVYHLKHTEQNFYISKEMDSKMSVGKQLLYECEQIATPPFINVFIYMEEWYSW